METTNACKENPTVFIEKLLIQLKLEYEKYQSDNFESIYKIINDTSECYQYCYDTACLQINYHKNRYSNILAHESTRALVPNVSYINANIIERYILSQGPIKHFVSDFWAMVLHYDVPIIISLAQENENGKSKFDAYFDDEDEVLVMSHEMDEMDNILINFKIRVNSKTQQNDNTILRKVLISDYRHLNKQNRKLKIKNNDIHFGQGIEQQPINKEILHVQYLGWPDHEAPKESEIITFLDIIPVIDKFDSTDPIIIHCSAGVGRSGSFCVFHKLYSIIQEILTGNISESKLQYMLETSDQDSINCMHSLNIRNFFSWNTFFNDRSISIDIVNTILAMRKYRYGLVQSKEQLQFCYIALIHSIEKLLVQ